jgi:peptidoglycan biosynthesis protein MviN/MurJ (putative lipid II flippase)
MSMMVSFKNWIVNDWKYNRFRLFCETLGSLAFIAIYLLMAWYGDDVCITTIFLIQLVGSSLHIINAYMRSSVNLIMLNIIVIIIALFGLAKMHLI